MGPAWELVRLGKRDQIEAVLSRRLRLWQGWPVDWDARALLHEAGRVARHRVARAPIQRIHALSQDHRAYVRSRGWARADR